MPKLDFDPVKDIPDLSGKVILITGGTAGLGYETALSLAAHTPAHVLFTGRSQVSADKLVKEVKENFPAVRITFVQCDLASLASVQHAAQEIVKAVNQLDIFIANAGIMALPHAQTKDGYEIQFGTNHVGHALLVKLLTPLMEAIAKATHDVRIVWLTSLGHMLQPKGGIVIDKLKTPQADIYPVMGRWYRYGQAKLANILYARAYSQHHPTITSVSVHPGVSITGLVSSLGLADRILISVTNIGKTLPAKQCAFNQQWAATAPLGRGPRQVETGCYYEPLGIKSKPQGEGTNDELAERLWEWTQHELQAYEIS